MSRPKTFFTVFLGLSLLIVSNSTAQVSTPQLLLEMIRPVRFSIIRHRPEAQSSEISVGKQALEPTDVNPDRATGITSKDPIRFTLNDSTGRHVRLEHAINTIDRMAYAISKPAFIFGIVRLFAMVISSLFVSIFAAPSDSSTFARRNRGKVIWTNIVEQLNRSDIESMIESIIRNYDGSLERSGIVDRMRCRDRHRRF